VKVGVWCAVSARRIVVPVSFNKTINCERYVQVILGQFFPELTEEERLYWPVSAKLSYCPPCTYLYMLCLMSSGTKLSAVVFGQHVHLILSFVIF
jgi:hypothetical protein